jgi:CopG family transcriptional regulator / antitoxin EndoAI
MFSGMPDGRDFPAKTAQNFGDEQKSAAASSDIEGHSTATTSVVRMLSGMLSRGARTVCDTFIYMAKLLSVSIPDELMRDAEAIARAQGKTKSELVRDALRRQVQLERLREAQRYGRNRAEERGLGPEDAEELVDQIRRSRD